MPVSDFLDEKRKEITDQLDRLKPIVEEYRRLEAAVAALERIPASTANGASAAGPLAGRRRGPGRPRGSKSASGPAAKATRAAGATTAKTRGGRRKVSGQRGAQALAVIHGQPGIAIPELARRIGMQQNYLYRLLPRLEREGKIAKQGRGWHPKEA
jgi:hypothetical protein